MAFEETGKKENCRPRYSSLFEIAPKCSYSISPTANKGKGFILLNYALKSRKVKSEYNIRCILSMIFNTLYVNFKQF